MGAEARDASALSSEAVSSMPSAALLDRLLPAGAEHALPRLEEALHALSGGADSVRAECWRRCSGTADAAPE